MKDEKKLHFSTSEEREFRSLCDEFDRLQKQCQNDLTPLLPGHVTDDTLQELLFEELTDSTIDRGTDAGILGDDMQRLLRFATAVGLVTKSSSNDLHELSHQLEACLITITSVMRRVFWKNGLTPPQPQDVSGLKRRLDELTRTFLNFLGEINKENTDSGKLKESSVDDVRNYVIVRTLGGVLLPFKRDLGHLMAG
ncbi:hypothetical protein OS493_015110 [Desmophyllum pertusum]|uniref:Uncharacterized protein n=1 Tax=Desmophyllum pertusum TaxID=174260 RepID=A0A9W9ZRD7_9CNID|nr:hypothetical protein OS493_015110 [Desmophyllum pertusum]